MTQCSKNSFNFNIVKNNSFAMKTVYYKKTFKLQNPFLKGLSHQIKN